MSWTAPAFMDELKARFDDWAPLSGVVTYTAPIDTPNSEDSIVMLRAPGTGQWSAIGNQRREEQYTVESTITAVIQGSGEEKAKEARDKAQEIVAEVEACFKAIVLDRTAVAETIGADQITDLNLSNVSLDRQGGGDGKRWAAADFDIQVTTRIS